MTLVISSAPGGLWIKFTAIEEESTPRNFEKSFAYSIETTTLGNGVYSNTASKALLSSRRQPYLRQSSNTNCCIVAINALVKVYSSRVAEIFFALFVSAARNLHKNKDYSKPSTKPFTQTSLSRIASLLPYFAPDSILNPPGWSTGMRFP